MLYIIYSFVKTYFIIIIAQVLYISFKILPFTHSPLVTCDSGHINPMSLIMYFKCKQEPLRLLKHTADHVYSWVCRRVARSKHKLCCTLYWNTRGTVSSYLLERSEEQNYS